MKARTIAIMLATLLISSSCVKNKLYDSDHPTQGEITLTTDWAKRTDGIAIPASYTATVGTYSAILGGTRNQYPNLIAPGNYTLYVFNTADKISINGTTVSVASLNQTSIDPMPGWLFSARAGVSIVADRSHNISVSMKQEVRQLSITLNIEGKPARIAKVEGTLTGVASAWNFNTDVPVGDAVGVAPAFTRTDSKITSTMRLLGIVPSVSQVLTLVVSFSDNSQQTITKDLSSLLKGFNANQHIPVSITASITVVEDDLEPGFTATINEWTSVANSNGIAS